MIAKPLRDHEGRVKCSHSRYSRNRIAIIGMPFRQLPTTSRRIGFELDAPAGMTVEPTRAGARVKGTIGELEVEAFQAALVIDRDGILEEKIRQATDAVLASDFGARVLQTIPIELAGASG